MTLYLSASLIKDFYECPRRAFYRMNNSEQSQQNKYMAIGSAVHEAIEKSTNSELGAIRLAHELLTKYNITEDIENVFKFTGNFFKMYDKDFFTPEDEVEVYFKVPYKEDVVMTGRIDRIHNNSIYDWKTTKKPPKDLDDDLQFIIYYWAYMKMKGTRPDRVVYTSLPLMREFDFHIKEEKLKKLEDEVIPEVVREIRAKNNERSGLSKRNACNFCSFRNFCFEEMEYGR